MSEAVVFKILKKILEQQGLPGTLLYIEKEEVFSPFSFCLF